MENQIDIWQTEVKGEIYESSFEELTQWINEGSLLPQDLVRRGNLRWLEAGKIPSLLPFFNARRLGVEPPQIHTSLTDARRADENSNPDTEKSFAPDDSFENKSGVSVSGVDYAENQDRRISQLEAGEESKCAIHTEDDAVFYCEICTNCFCPQCPKGYGGKVKICPLCGAMCKKIGETDEKKVRDAEHARAIKEGFGLKDIGNAFVHPFKFKTSFVFGGVMFMMFTLGQTAGAIGGLFMMFAALFCYLLANMLGFGVLSNTVEKFSQGKLEKNFMPDFEDFNLWDDVIHPFFLSIGVYLSSFGALFLALIVGSYLLVSSMNEHLKKAEIQKAQTAAPFMIDERKAQNQTDEVKKLIESVKQKAEDKKALTEDDPASKSPNADALIPADNDAQIGKINRMIEQNRETELESVIGKNDETEDRKFAQMAQSFLNLGLPLLLLTGIALVWGVFYFPAACAVAGYTRSFRATVNPTVGIDTIRHFGADYLKILGVFVLLLTASGVFGAVINFVFSPLALPRMGNPVAVAVTSWITFYFTIVFSCLLGYALYKNSEKFKFYRG